MAAVYIELISKAILLSNFTYEHRAGFRQYTSYYYLALSCVFDKQSPPPILCHFKIIKSSKKKTIAPFFYITLKHSFSKSYRVILPSSLDFVNSFTLVYSTKLRELVISTVFIYISFFMLYLYLFH